MTYTPLHAMKYGKLVDEEDASACVESDEEAGPSSEPVELGSAPVSREVELQVLVHNEGS